MSFTVADTHTRAHTHTLRREPEPALSCYSDKMLTAAVKSKEKSERGEKRGAGWTERKTEDDMKRETLTDSRPI